MPHDVFISYATQDRQTAGAVCAAIESRGIGCWMSPRDIQPGGDWLQGIIDAIDRSKVLVVVFSSHSNRSPALAREVERAIYNDVAVLPLRIEDVAPSAAFEFFIGSAHWYDALTPPLEQHLERFAYAVEMLVTPRSQRGKGFGVPPPRPPAAHSLELDRGDLDAPTFSRRMETGDAAGPSDAGGRRWFRRVFDVASRVRPLRSESLPVSSSPDPLYLSVIAPQEALTGTSFVIDAWIHLASQRRLVMARSRSSHAEPIVARTGPAMLVSQGTVLTIRLDSSSMTVDEPQCTITWVGEASCVNFAASVPPESKDAETTGVVRVYRDGVQIARVHLVIELVRAPVPAGRDRIVQQEAHRTAFASYATRDRKAVLARVQGMQKGAPGLGVFMDALSLRSGADWQEELWRVIPRCDVFYLFWSKHALKSEWVEKEWRCALQTRGLEFIDPVPLASPASAPPPLELASKHFNDWTLEIKSPRARRSAP